MKTPIHRMLAAILAWLALVICARANISYQFAHGHGVQHDTVMTEYDESCDFDYSWNYTAPMVGWYSTTFSYGYLLTVYVDTDYAVGSYFNVCYQTNGAPIDIYIN